MQRCLNHVLDELNLHIATLATDRHYAVMALMKASYPNINHQFDVWHLSKSVTKKLTKVGNNTYGGWPKHVTRNPMSLFQSAPQLFITLSMFMSGLMNTTLSVQVLLTSLAIFTTTPSLLGFSGYNHFI